MPDATTVLGRDRASIAACRQWLRERLADEPTEVRDQVLLLASEVATNAYLHARTDVFVSVTVGPRGVRVEVRDGSDLPPLRRHLGTSATMGRGLVILDSLASAWGVDASPDGHGKVVWFEVSRESVPRDAAGTDARGADAPVTDAPTHPEPDPERLVRLIGTPIGVTEQAWEQYGRIVGEVRLLDQASEDTRRLFSLLDAAEAAAPNLRIFSLVQEELVARSDHAGVVDLELRASDGAAEAARCLDEFLDALEELYRLRPALLLSPPPTTQSRALRKWLLGEFVRQREGLPPMPWSGVDA